MSSSIGFAGREARWLVVAWTAASRREPGALAGAAA